MFIIISIISSHPSLLPSLVPLLHPLAPFLTSDSSSLTLWHLCYVCDPVGIRRGVYSSTLGKRLCTRMWVPLRGLLKTISPFHPSLTCLTLQERLTSTLSYDRAGTDGPSFVQKSWRYHKCYEFKSVITSSCLEVCTLSRNIWLAMQRCVAFA